MEDFIKVCPNCNKENDASSDFCMFCGENIKLVIPTPLNKKSNEEKNNVEVKKIESTRYYKVCRVCGSKNYLLNKDEFLDCCKACGNEDINDVPTMEEKSVNEVSSNEKKEIPQVVVKDIIYPKLVFSDNHIIEIKKEEILGRYGSIDSSYFMQNPYVSAEHAKIFKKDDGNYYLTDLSSTNGTKINGINVLPNMANLLQNGYKVVLANLEFTFVYED